MSASRRITARGLGVDVAVWLLAGVVHALTLLTAALGIYVLFTSLVLFIRLALAVLLLGIFLTVQPLQLRRSALPNGMILARGDAPALFGLLDEVAAAANTKNVRRVLVTANFNAAYMKDRRRRPVVEIGIPLWVVLSRQERVAVLGHEMGHRVNGDLRDTAFVHYSLVSLDRWLYLLHPSRTQGRTVTYSPFMSAVQIADMLVPFVLLPFALLVFAFGSVLNLLGQRQGQRAEYIADQVAARVAGLPAGRGLADTLLLAEACVGELRRIILFRRRENPWQALRAFVDGLPDTERQRLQRLAAKRLNRIDETHPPSHLRRELLDRLPATQAKVVPGEDIWDAVARDLNPGAAAATRHLKSRFGVD